MIDRGDERIWRQNNCVNDRGMLNASHLKSLFARLVSDAVAELGYGGYAIIGISKFLAQDNDFPAIWLVH